MGSDAVHVDPNYSSAYVSIYCKDASNPKDSDKIPVGRATIFTIGSGNELCQKCVLLMAHIVEGKNLYDVVSNFGKLWRALTNHH